MRTIKEISDEMREVQKWSQAKNECHRTCKLVNLANELYATFKAQQK